MNQPMNQLPEPEASSSYDKDFYLWSCEQAELIRSGRLAELDFENLAEEIESMGKREKRELMNRTEKLLMHLMKWHYQPEANTSNSWKLTIIDQRTRLGYVLADNPSLKPNLSDSEWVQKHWNRARVKASLETGLPLETFADVCPWTMEQVLDDDWLPEPVKQ